jgi:hypothetical protein
MLSKNDAGVELADRSLPARGMIDVKGLGVVTMTPPDWAWPWFLHETQVSSPE